MLLEVLDFLSKQFYLAKPKSPIFKSGVTSLVDKSKFCKFEKNQQALNQTQEMSNLLPKSSYSKIYLYHHKENSAYGCHLDLPNCPS